MILKYQRRIFNFLYEILINTKKYKKDNEIILLTVNISSQMSDGTLNKCI